MRHLCLLLFACSPSASLPVGGDKDPTPAPDSGEEGGGPADTGLSGDGADGGADGADGSDGAAADGGGPDSGEGGGGDSGGGDGDAPIEDIGDSPLAITFDPPGSAFTEGLSVTIAAGDPELQVWYSTSSDDPLSEGSLVEGAIELTDHQTICASASGGEVRCESYFKIDPDMASWSSNIPVMVLQAQARAPSSTSEIAILAAMGWFDPGAESGRTVLDGPATHTSRAGWQMRGSSSSGFPKTPYRIELWSGFGREDRDLPLGDMPAEADWVLLSPYCFDLALMRNAFIYELARDIGRYAPRTRFVELYTAVRGEPVSSDDYMGVYVVTEMIEQGPDRVDIAELDPDDISGEAVTGGYIFKRDRLGSGEVGFWAGDAGGAFYFPTYLAYVDPEEADLAAEQREWLTDTIDEFGWSLADSEGVGPGGVHWRDQIDQAAWIDDHILNTYSKNPDAFRLSGYFHIDRGGPIAAGPIWDFDRALGATYDGRSEDPAYWDATHITSDTTDLMDFGWYGALLEDEEFRAAWYDRWDELLAGPLSEAELGARVDAMSLELAEAGPRDLARWPDYPARGDGSWEAEVALFRQWLIDRRDWIADCVASRPADPDSCR